jgi:hypothetical protein
MFDKLELFLSSGPAFNNAAKPVQNTENDTKCTKVRHQPDPA